MNSKGIVILSVQFFFSCCFIKAIPETDVFYFLPKFPAYNKTRYFIEQTKLPEVVKFSEASEESTFPLGKGLVGSAEEFSTAEGTSNKMLDTGSAYVVSAITEDRSDKTKLSFIRKRQMNQTTTVHNAFLRL